MVNKEFLYIGHYYDILGNYILKIGTTNNLERRRKEHTKKYKESPNCTMPQDGQFVYDWHLPLSKWNTRRFEEINIDLWKEMGIGEYVRNDRFRCDTKPEIVQIAIRKVYQVAL